MRAFVFGIFKEIKYYTLVLVFSVMSETFVLAGRSSDLSIDVSPEIVLDRPYEVGLKGIHTYNSIPNIEEGVNNKFYYWNGGGEQKIITVPEGSYEINHIEKVIQDALLLEEQQQQNTDQETRDKIFSLKPNNNTIKCELFSKYQIDFTPPDSLASLLGFSNTRLPANTWHFSDKPVDINKVHLVQVFCNLTSSSHFNEERTHSLYEFMPDVEPGWQINEQLNPVDYKDVHQNLDSIRNINVKLVDQNSRLVNFRGEEIIIRLLLRPKDATYRGGL